LKRLLRVMFSCWRYYRIAFFHVIFPLIITGRRGFLFYIFFPRIKFFSPN
jgi:hypothetical protein